MIRTLKSLSEIATISTWALLGAGVVATIVQIFFVLMLRYGWSSASEKNQLMFIGFLALIQALSPLAVVAALAKARVAAHGPGTMGFDLSSGGTDAPPNAGTKITVETTKP